LNCTAATYIFNSDVLP